MANKKLILPWLLLLILTASISAYPAIISEKGTNHSLNKKLVFGFPESYYNGVDSITFTNTPVKYGEHNKTGRYSINWWKFRNGDIYFYNGRIWIYGMKIKGYDEQKMKQTLHHELCHIQGYAKERILYNDEKYAEKCILR